MKAKLLTRDGDLVHEFDLPPFQLLPEVMFWGSRVFILREPFTQSSSKKTAPDYFEACCWSVDVSDFFSSKERLKNGQDQHPMDR